MFTSASNGRRIVRGVAAAIAVSTGAALLAACSPSTGDAVAFSCSIYQSGNSLRVTFSGPDEDVCATQDRSLSGGLDFWTQQEIATSERLSAACGMRKGSESALVEDSGGQVGGRMVCSAFLQAGWAEDHTVAQEADDRRAAEETAAAQPPLRPRRPRTTNG